MKQRIIALIGEAGSGKDSILEEILKLMPDANRIVSATTRPPRSGEKEGISYFFMTEEQFKQTTMIESTCFNDWYYGIPENSIKDGWNVGVFNPTGVQTLIDYGKYDIIPIKLKVSDKERLMRQIRREIDPDIKEICRRFLADGDDFKDLPFNVVEVDNSNLHSPTETAGHIAYQIGKWVEEYKLH
jgi:guanylate kinase